MGSDLWSNGTGVTSKWAQEYLKYYICHAVTTILFATAQSITQIWEPYQHSLVNINCS